MGRHWRFLAIPLLLVSLSQGAAGRPAVTAGQIEQRLGKLRADSISNPDAMLRRLEQVRQLVRQLPEPDRSLELAATMRLQAEASMQLNKPAVAQRLLAQAGVVLDRVKARGKPLGDLLASRGYYESITGSTGRALEFYQRAYEQFRTVHDARSEAVSLIYIALLYQDANDSPIALKYYKQAMSVYQGDAQFSISLYNNIALVERALGRYDIAAAQLRPALKLAQASGSRSLVVRVLNNEARIQLSAGRLMSAERAISQGLGISAAASPDDRAQLYATAAQAELQRGRLPQAATLIQRAFAGVDTTRTTIRYRDPHQTAYDIFSRLGDAPDALAHLAALKRLDDAATKVATSANSALMAARFDFANQELRLAKVQREAAERRAATQRLVLEIGSAATLVVIALLGFGILTIRRSRNQVARANVELGATNAALEKALAAKTEFLATTSHEIRTPLNGILGMTQVMLADPRLAAPVRERVQVVHGAGIAMRALVDDILDVAKMEAGKLAVEAVPLDLCGTLGDLVRLWEETASAKGLSFNADLKDCPATLMGDPARIRQVVLNLLSNALKFTQAGTITLRSWAVEDGEGPPRYRVSVRDSGIGIPADKQALIFDSFRQADTSTTRRFGGTGLGLAICRNLARAMGGDVTVVSAEGEGATFTLELPLIPAEAPRPAPAVADTLLIIERNPIARATLKALLAPHVPALAVAAGLEEAVERLRAGGVTRVLADDATLRGDGLTAALTRLRAAGDVPVMLLWSATAGEDRADLATADALTLIEKPITRPALAQFIIYNMDHEPRRLVSQAA